MKELSEEMKSVFKQLQGLGFIHVTGLPTADPTNGNRFDGNRPIFTSKKDWGKTGRNHDFTVAVTTEGHVWVRVVGENLLDHSVQNLLKVVCPNGGGCLVPCSSFQMPVPMHLMQRCADPLWEGGDSGRLFPSEPEKAEEKARKAFHV